MSKTASNVTVAELLSHAAWARRLARSLTADDATAEDLVQETWIAATQHPPATDRPLRPWLAVVLRNLFLKRTLGERRREARHARLAAEGGAVSPDVLVEKVEVQRLLADLVTSLEEPYRQALILRYFEDLSAADIARKLGIPAGTVRWRLKAALEELRKRLDERHGGRRERWLAALLPLAPSPRSHGWGWALGIGAVGAAAGLAFTTGQRVSERRPAAPLVEKAARPPSFGGSPPVWAAAIPVDLGSCQREVKQLRADSAAAEVERRQRLNGRELFPLGAPNPAAAEAITPAIERIMKGTRGVAPSHTLECRTWVCRMLVAQTREEEPHTNDWHRPLQRDEEMRERTAGMGFHSGNPSKDPLSGVGLAQEEIFIKLADPSGKRMPEPRKPPPPAVSSAPLPATPDSCAAEVKALRAQLQTAREEIEAHASPMERFDKGAPDPRLTGEFRAKLLTKFSGPETADLDVDCRNLICRVRWPGGPMNWHNQLSREPWFRQMTDGAMVGREVHFVMAPGPRADGLGFLQDLVKRFDASRAPDDCAARFPATGTLKVKFDLPKTGKPNDDGELGRVSAVYGDALAGTPLGKCLEEAITKSILPAPLPKLPVGGAVLYYRFTFPRKR